MINLNHEITDYETLRLHYCYRDGFVFTSISTPSNVYDAILIRNPSSCDAHSPKLGFSEKSLAEHIAFIHEHQISKAIIIAEDLSFLTDCPSLESLVIIPARDGGSALDYSPLYQMKQIASLDCYPYADPKQHSPSTVIDCSKLCGLRKLWIRHSGVVNYGAIDSLEELYLYDCHTLSDLQTIGGNTNLKKLSCTSCKLRSLNGIEKLEKLQWLDVCYGRALGDITALTGIHAPLRMLSIENCPKITDFSCLSYLDKIEFLELLGSNTLSDLNFIPCMPNLQLFSCTMNVADGNISPCLSVPYVDLKNRRHYNLKNADLGKTIPHKGFQFI